MKSFFSELKALVLIFDAFNNCMFYSIAISGEPSKGNTTTFLFAILGILFLLGSLTILLLKFGKEGESLKKWSLAFAMLLSTTAYFIGDNLPRLINTYEKLNCDPAKSNSTAINTCGKEATIASLYLITFGIIGFRFIPLIEKKVTHIQNETENSIQGLDS